MHESEASVSTYMGNFLAIPHGNNEAKGNITSSAVSIVRYPNGIDWNGKPVKSVVGIVGIAGVNNEHLAILSSIARVFPDKAQVARLEAATTVEEILDIFGKLSRHERFVGPAAELAENGVISMVLLAVIGTALRFDDLGDAEAVELAEIISANSAEDATAQITGLEPEHPLFSAVGALMATRKSRQ